MRRKKGTRTLTQPSLLPQSLARQLFSDGSSRSDKEVGGGGGGWSSRPWDKRGDRLKIFFRPFGPQFGLEIRGRAPSLDPPLLFIYPSQQEAEESDAKSAKWGAESQKQQKSGRGLKRQGALIFCHPFSFHETVFPLCRPHYLKAWNEQRISVWTHVEILVELVLVRVHTGWFSSLLSPPRFMALIRASIGQLLSLL